MQQDINKLAVLAATNSDIRDSLLQKQELFILRSASRTVKQPVRKSDDEWSVALIAFLRAIQSYDNEKGNFLSYADKLIHNSLIDYCRTQNRFQMEISVSPGAFDGNVEQECEETALQYAVATHAVAVRDITLKEEIEALGETLSDYGFSFFDLTACSPKTGKTKTACAVAVKALQYNPVLMYELRQTRMLPVQKLQTVTGIQRKILERHRRYIIAAAEIMFGEFNALAEYLPFIRKGAGE